MNMISKQNMETAIINHKSGNYALATRLYKEVLSNSPENC